MADERTLANAYLQARVGGFWEWADDGAAIVWADGSTLAFREEVEKVLEALGDGMPPPFPALLLVLGACRENWLDIPGAHGILRAMVREWGEMDAATTPRLEPVLEDVLTHLGAIHNLAREHRIGAEAKIAIARAVFEPAEAVAAGSTRAHASRALLRGIQQGLGTFDLRAADATTFYGSVRALQNELEATRDALRRFDPATLDLRKRTGLEQLVTPAPLPEEIELPPSARVRRLLDSLKTDPDMSPLAALSRDLMAAVHLPRPVTAPDELPLGGVSDVSNRGPLHRLVLSELAHDGLMLAARVALNEALYLRREYPPQTPIGQRFILLDAGIRLWGVPRVFATAVGLALAATAGAHTELAVFGTKGDEIEPVDLATREGLIAQLSALRPEAHPGAALGAFLEAAGATEAPTQAIVVTHAEALADPDFAAALAKLEGRSFYIATVDREGQFELKAVSARGRKLIAAAKLGLDEVLARPPEFGATELVDPRASAEVPLICSGVPFPFLLPFPIRPSQSCYHHRHGLAAMAHDRRVMIWSTRGKGATQITAETPRGSVRWMRIDDHDTLRLLIVPDKDRDRLALLSVTLPELQVAETTLEHKHDQKEWIHCERNTLFFIGPRAAHAFDLLSGASRTRELPDGVAAVPGCGRYVRGRDGKWAALSLGAAGIVLIPMTPPRWVGNTRLLYLFDRPGHDGPWAVTADHQIVSLAEEQSTRFGLQDAQVRPDMRIFVSSDGQRVLFPTSSTAAPNTSVGHWVSLEGEGGFAHATSKLSAEAVELGGVGHMEQRPLFKNFQGIAVDNGQLALIPSKQPGTPGTPGRRVWFVDLEVMRLHEHSPWSENAPGVFSRPFEEAESPPGVGYRLAAATFGDGSRAYLDSRGLLHLCSADRQLPQLSIVLAGGGKVAAWSSDGKVGGDSYFFAEKASAEAEHFHKLLGQFIARLV